VKFAGVICRRTRYLAVGGFGIRAPAMNVPRVLFVAAGLIRPGQVWWSSATGLTA